MLSLQLCWQQQLMMSHYLPIATVWQVQSMHLLHMLR